MSIAKVRAALETRLGTLAPALSSAFENKAFEPVAGTPYQRVYVLPARTLSVGQDLRTRQLTGIFQVSLFYPINTYQGASGITAVQTRADLLCAHFAAGTRLIFQGVRVNVDEPPSISTGFPDGDRFVVPVSIRYIAFIS